MIRSAGDGGWTKPSREHREAVDAFLNAAGAVPPARWRAPLGTGRWTPAQLAEHVVRAYEVAVQQLQGQPPVRARVGPLAQRVLRFVLLPHILFHRSIPVRARSPSAIAPSAEGLGHDELAPRLRAAAEALEREFRTTSLTELNHPYFGGLHLRKAMRFVAAHTDHHRKQLERARLVEPGPPS